MKTKLEQEQFMLKKLITYLEDTESKEQIAAWSKRLKEIDEELGKSLEDFY